MVLGVVKEEAVEEEQSTMDFGISVDVGAVVDEFGAEARGKWR